MTSVTDTYTMGSIEVEVVTEKPDDGEVMVDSHCIARPPTYSTIDIQVGTGKDQQVAESKKAHAPKTIFEQEFQSFCDDLASDPKQKKKLEFLERIKTQNGTAAPATIQDSVENLARNCSDKKLRRVYGAFLPVVEALKDYTGVIDTMIQAYPMPLALIWGGLKIVLDCAGRYSQQFEQIKTELQMLPNILWDLTSCEELYGVSPYGADVVRRVIGRSYKTIFNFWYRSAKILEHPKRYVLMENRKLAGLVTELERNWVTLSRIRDGVEAQLNKTMRETIAAEATLAEGTKQSLTVEFVKTALERSAAQIEREKAEEERGKAEADRLAAQKDRELAQVERQKAAEEREAAEVERRDAQSHRVTDLTWKTEQMRVQAGTEMRSLMARIESRDQFSFGIFNSVLKERHPGTCEWLFQHKNFQSWAREDSVSPVLWLNGKHGAGKSFLCASAIDFIRGQPAPNTVAFQFLTKDQYTPRIQLLRNLAWQLLNCLVCQSIETPPSLQAFLQINKDDSGSLERLIHFVLQELPFTYIFVDGLDEVDYTEGQCSAPAYRYNKEVPDFVTFLIQEAIQFPGKLRLFCSSQPVPAVQDYLCKPEWANAITEIALQIEDTADDIRRYFLAAIPDTTPDTTAFARTLVTSTIATDIEGSFLWASSMLRDLQDEAEDTDDLIRLANEGLPREMSSLYAKAINRMKKQDGGSKKLPLWKIVLSLLTFSKRPLRIAEIIEAVAMIRTAKGENLSDNKRVDPRKILNGCLSLVRYIKIDCNYQNDILHLSHSAVRTFLMKHSDKADAPPHEEFADSRILRDSCLQYLSQPRYSKMLEKDAYGMFWTVEDEGTTDHRLLSYAAKYWYQHFDTEEDCSGPVPPQPHDKDQVVGFLRSTSFKTCLQVQSLFVIGHFLQMCDNITDQVRTVRKTLPNWMPLHENSLHRQYLEFQGEWCDLLQCGQSRQFNGELDRCFWGALGSNNFLSNSNCRYKTFDFKKRQPKDGANDRCQIQQLSPDGKSLTTGWIQNKDESTSLHLEQWAIDGIETPTLVLQTMIQFSMKDSQLNLYSLPCAKTFRSFPLIPNGVAVIPPEAICIGGDGSTIRIGASLFGRNSRTHKEDFVPIKERALQGEPWEDICTRGSYLVTCRRRIQRPQPPAMSSAKERRSGREARYRVSNFGTSRRCTKDVSSDDDDDSDDDSDEDAQSSDEQDGHESSTSGDDSSTGGEDSAEESWSEDSDSEDTSEDESDYEEAAQSDPEEFDDDLEVEESEKLTSGSSIIESNPAPDSEGSSISSILDSEKSVLSFDEAVADDSDTGSNGSIQSDTSERSALAPELLSQEVGKSQYPVEIAGASGIKYCDGCNKEDIVKYLHCLICGKKENDFDLCNSCERRGRWCYDKNHQLYRVINSKFAGVVASRRNFNIQQELHVYKSDDKGKRSRIFRFRRNLDCLLHNSPPVIHPQFSLVVWAASGDILLFADFEGNTFFEQKLNASKKARPICVDLSFSSCGGLLRVASIEAVIERSPNDAQDRKRPGAKQRVCLYMHVIILKLSSKKPTKIPPKMVASTSLRLGYDMKHHVQNLPFAFTWTRNDLYLTVSHSRLRVYRIAFPRTVLGRQEISPSSTPEVDTNNDSRAFTVTVPSKCIFLPRSSRNRSVQFFPPDVPGQNSVLIIGPRHDKHPTPPIGVYLKGDDLGNWISLEDKEGEGMLHTPHKRLQGQFEEFDEDLDCDLIPFD
ncbi:hypothetical protein BKA65DRAFT_141598 [Rhexocercosporidium sp. MPI-PUGE-AT-0058]|nr:hypothetical protein BKA65DRAFT_141598 [Rhexocercosporidium sp. MPI-PUGE-AT-0058]